MLTSVGTSDLFIYLYVQNTKFNVDPFIDSTDHCSLVHSTDAVVQTIITSSYAYNRNYVSRLQWSSM